MKLASSAQCMNSSLPFFAVSKRSDKIRGKGSDMQKELIQLGHNIWLTLTASHKASCAELCSEIPETLRVGV